MDGSQCCIRTSYRGSEFASCKGPNNKIESWYDNWCEFGESHESVRLSDHTDYPVSPSDHRGLGGCGTHDTRITFQIRKEQKERIAKEMNWDVYKLDCYYQAALNLMPLAPAIKVNEQVEFYTHLIESISKSNNFGRLPDDEHKSLVTVNSVANSSLAMYSDEELRWTSAYLIDEANRPTNLTVMTDAVVDKVTFTEHDNELIATGVDVIVSGKEHIHFVLHLNPSYVIIHVKVKRSLYQ